MEKSERLAAERQYSAAMSNERGRMFEDAIMGGCRMYKDAGRAKIEKTPEPFRCIGKKNGIATVRFTAHAEPDFIGCCHGGKAIVFEAKFTDKGRLKQDAVTKTQAASLQAYENLGAISAVCVGIQDRFYMVPWMVFSRMKELYGRKYIMQDDIPEYRVRFNGCVLFLDYADPRMGKFA